MSSIGTFAQPAASYRTHLHTIRSLRKDQTRRASGDTRLPIGSIAAAGAVGRRSNGVIQNEKTSNQALDERTSMRPIPATNYAPLKIGLENLGNTCFMNSVLQCALHIKPLVLYVLSNDCMTDVNAASSTKGQVALAFRELAKLLTAAKSGSAVAPSSFRRTLGRWAPQLLDFQQQDSQEFLRFLLDALSNDLCRKNPNSPSTARRKGSWHARLRLPGGSSSSNSGSTDQKNPTAAGASPEQSSQMQQSQPSKQPPLAFPSKALAQAAPSDVAASATLTNPTSSPTAQQQADQAWAKFAASNNSIITGTLMLNIPQARRSALTEPLVCSSRRFICRPAREHRGVPDLPSQIVLLCPFLDLSLPLPKTTQGRERKTMFRSAGSCTLADCFRCLVQEEVLEGSNAYMCDKCGQKRRAVRRLAVYKSPPVLVVHLKRFSYDIFSREKLDTEVQFPLTGLDISPYLSTESNVDASAARYNLIGVCNHMGSIRGGHYTAYVHLLENAQAQGSWCLFNDRQASVVPSERVCSRSGYVLFYQRQS